MFAYGSAINLNELRLNYFPEIKVLPDTDLLLNSDEKILLVVSPGSIQIMAVFLKSDDHTLKADLTQQIGDGNLELTIERP
jgi:hypothetical protein